MKKGVIAVEKFTMIENYLLDRMSAVERNGFQEQLKQDAQLREETEAMRENINAIELGCFTREVKELVKEQSYVITIEGSDRRHHPWKYIAYAASIAALIAMASWFFARPPLHERLFAQYHVPDPGLPVAMSATDDHLFHDAMVAYKLGDLKEAREKWTSLLQDSPDSDTLLYYIASAHLNEGDPEAAIPLFERVSADITSEFNIKAKWYLFLSYVYLNELEKARTVAPANDPYYGEKVEEVIARLDP